MDNILNNLKDTLQKIKLRREEELKPLERRIAAYQSSQQYLGLKDLMNLGNNQNIKTFTQDELIQRKMLLTLELPYKTDLLSVLETLGSIYKEKSEKRSRKLEKSADSILKEWCNEDKNKITFLNVLRARGTFHYDCDTPSENLGNIFCYEQMQNYLVCLSPKISDDTIRTYLSHAKNLSSFLNKDLHLSHNLFLQKESISLLEASRFFETLETRALKSSTIRAFEDLLLCRALTYIPVTGQQLFSLGIPDKDNLTIGCGTQMFNVPRTFIELCDCFSLSDRLLPKQLKGKEEKFLHQKIQRLGEYATLSVKLTPSILRKAFGPICCKALQINSQALQLLPRR